MPTSLKQADYVCQTLAEGQLSYSHLRLFVGTYAYTYVCMLLIA